MIGFELTDEQKKIQAVAHDFAEQVLRPAAAEYDEKEEVNWDALRKAARLGLTSFFLPKEYGGGGYTDLTTQVIVKEELIWGCAGQATSIAATALAATPILQMGNEAQKARYIPRFCDPEVPRLGAMALTEREAGSDVVAMKTEAVRDGNEWVLNGTKCFITNGGIADVHVVFACTNREAGPKGITGFIVESGTPGFRQGKKENKMGIRATHVAEVIMEDVRLSDDNRLGEEGHGFSGAMRMLDRTRVQTASGAVGIARAAYEYSRDYAKNRVQFGQSIVRQQAIGFMLADMAMQVDAARLLTWRAAELVTRGARATREASMAKTMAADTAVKVTTDAIQIMGGYGYMKDHPVEKWLRDSKIFQIFEGTNQIQRVIISRDLP